MKPKYYLLVTSIISFVIFSGILLSFEINPVDINNSEAIINAYVLGALDVLAFLIGIVFLGLFIISQASRKYLKKK